MKKKAAPGTDTTTDPDRRICGMVAVAVPSGQVTKPVFGRFGFVSGSLVTDWPAIVGPALASHTIPVGIRFPPKSRSEGVLTIKVAASAFATEIKHLEPLVIERINGYFGYQAVSRLALKHGPLPLPRRPAQDKAPLKPLPASEAKRLSEALEAVDDPELKAALEGLGRRLGGR